MTGEQFAHWIEESTSTVFFGGAGTVSYTHLTLPTKA